MASEIPPLRPGDPKRIGPYRPLARLGAGGMGRVYLGRSQGGRTVAVKVIHPNLSEDPQFRRRFSREVAAARRVSGIYTAQVVDAGPDDVPPWLATEYVAGPTLQQAIDEHGALPDGSVAALGAGLAEGLRVIHAQSVVHRDLKPGNVLLAADGPRIIDFGIARAMDATSVTTRSGLVGTPGYMSPEQYRGREIGPASDVFCLASVLVFAATGRRPFGDGPFEALGYRVVNEDPDLRGVPASLHPLVSAGLEKDPDDRPGVPEFLDRCSALAPDEGLSLPVPVATMITTRVAETEALVGKATAVQPKKPAAVPQEAPPPPVKKSSSGTGTAAAVMAVVLVLAGLWFANRKFSDGGRSSSTPAATSTPSAYDSYGGDETYSPSYSPTPTTDPTQEAFEGISTGDCLDAHEDPYDDTEWSEDLPAAVDCDRPDAYVRVTNVSDTYSDCGDQLGETWWDYDADGESIALCVERRLRVGECFLGKKSEHEGRIAINDHGVLTSWGCDKSTVPREFDYILRVTDLTNGTCPDGSRSWDFRGGHLCAKVT